MLHESVASWPCRLARPMATAPAIIHRSLTGPDKSAMNSAADSASPSTPFPARRLAVAASAWSGLAATKFRAPRPRREVVARDALLQRALDSARERRVTLVCAPAGFGKSTLLLQLASALDEGAESAWLQLDTDDNDINRLFVSLLGALRGVALEWEVDPHILAAQVREAGPQARAALAGLINALSSYQGERLLLILDDLHRVSDAGALQLLGDFIERLPPEVGVAIGSRVEPALPLARWRARGEVGELLMGDLQFTAADLEALARAREASGLSAAMSAEYLAQALQRTQGWAAGLQLVLGATDSHAVTSVEPAVDRAAGRHLFDFFAQEVLAELPADLQDFILHCAVLPELSPALCQAVTGRDDAGAVLEALYRRGLFLSALDEQLPVLRFHDLFAEFLHTRLTQRHPGLDKQLHARAARAEALPMRAVAHWLRAGAWEEAIACMGRCVEPLLAEGGLATMARWIAQLPPEVVRDNPEVAHLNALCAWSAWDFERVVGYLQQAVAGFRRAGRDDDAMRSLALLPRAFNAVGRLDEATRALAEADRLPLPVPQRVICEGARAWQKLAMGEPEAVAAALAAFAEQAELDPGLLQPAIDDMFNSFIFGLPGTREPLLRLRRLCREAAQRNASLWQVEAFANTTWPEFLYGDRAATEAAVARQAEVTQRLSMLTALRLNDGQARAWLAAARGDLEAAVHLHRGALQAMAELDVPGLTATWRRATTHNLAHFHWMAGDLDSLKALWPLQAPARSAVEWPFVDTGRAVLHGRIALLEGRLAEAERALLEAERLQQRWCMPTFFGDVRLSLALLRLAQSRPEAAWQSFAPVLQQALTTDCLGPLLMESAAQLERLLALIPSSWQANPALQALLARLASWRDAAPVRPQGELPPALRALSEREREVLACIAAGDSNKLIARALNLSPHTVKRHVANILTKLDCSTRGQAAAAWRATR